MLRQVYTSFYMFYQHIVHVELGAVGPTTITFDSFPHFHLIVLVAPVVISVVFLCI